MKKLEEPIAGANYAADIRNYPWHRPPDIVSYDEGVDYLINKMNEPEELELVYSLLAIEAQVATIVSSILMQGISRGKFSIDLAILMAGPLARYVGILADEQDIKYDMGISDKDRIKVTPTSLRIALGIVDGNQEEILEETIEDPVEEDAGLMSVQPIDDTVASPDEQAEMLGSVEDPVEETIEEPVTEEESV